MRFEPLESRFAPAYSLGPAVEFDIDTSAEVVVDPPPAIPDDLNYRSTSDDFDYSSIDVDAALLEELIQRSREVAESSNPQARTELPLNDTDRWLKTGGYYPPIFEEDGYFVAERLQSHQDPHAMYIVKKNQSQCFNNGGIYMTPDKHFQFSFSVRYPESEMSWLSNHRWALVTQLWGPREPGETARNPPFAIYTRSVNGEPVWVIRSVGDSRRITQSGEYEDMNVQTIPMTGIGEWQNWDVEFVPNSFGDGLVRVWLNGERIIEWKNVKNTYNSKVGGIEAGPVGPMFGLYSSMDEDGMEAHFDHMYVHCSGDYQTSIAGTTTGGTQLGDNIVFARDKASGENFATRSNRNGVFSLNVPAGEYTLTAIDPETGHQVQIDDVDTRQDSPYVSFNLKQPPQPRPQQTMTLTGDVNGDGRADIINRLADGSWQVTLADSEGDTGASSRRPRGEEGGGGENGGEGGETGNGEEQNSGEEQNGGEATPETFSSSVWSSWSAKTEWEHIQTGDFDGDGKTDLVGRSGDGNWWVAKSLGDRFVTLHFGRWATGVEWTQVRVGDFNGDGKSDLAGRAANNGQWWVGLSDGSKFQTTFWGKWTTATDWTVETGDFNGDGNTDLAGRAADGTWWVGLSTGSSFQTTYWGRWTTITDWTVRVGDFDGDGRSDILGRAERDGTIWVAESTGSSFDSRFWGRWNNNVQWLNLTATDIDGDGRTDLAARANTDGTWWLAKSDGSRFQSEYWGRLWAPDLNWHTVQIGDFDGDGDADLLGVNEESWWLAK